LSGRCDSQRQDPAPALPSATIVLARDTARELEVLLVKRRAGDAFGDSYTFPGGVVDNDECKACESGNGMAASDADKLLGCDAGGLDFYCAAIRELFEETGILLTRTPVTGSNCCQPADIRNIDLQRQQVDRGELPWSEFLARHELSMAFDNLHYFAHWETPLSQPKRWSTRFFAARLPEGQLESLDGNELTDSCWLTASEALARHDRKEIVLPYPTAKTLQAIDRLRSTNELLIWAHEQQRQGITRKRLDSVRP